MQLLVWHKDQKVVCHWFSRRRSFIVSNIVPKNLSMKRVVRHVGQAMHEANDLIPTTDAPTAFQTAP